MAIACKRVTSCYHHFSGGFHHACILGTPRKDRVCLHGKHGVAHEQLGILDRKSLLYVENVTECYETRTLASTQPRTSGQNVQHVGQRIPKPCPTEPEAVVVAKRSAPPVKTLHPTLCSS